MRKFWRRVLLFPLTILMGVDGDLGGTDGNTDGSGSGDSRTPGDTGTDGGSTGGSPGDSGVDDKSGQDDKPQGAPEKYEAFTVPDGLPADPNRIEAAQAIFKELNLTQAQAQKLVDLQIEGVKQSSEAFEADKTQRLDAIKSDKEFGGDKFAESEEMVGRALGTYLKADEQLELAEYVKKFGPSPALFRLMYRVAKSVKEDTVVNANGGNGQQGKDRLSALYPSMSK